MPILSTVVLTVFERHSLFRSVSRDAQWMSISAGYCPTSSGGVRLSGGIYAPLTICYNEKMPFSSRLMDGQTTLPGFIAHKAENEIISQRVTDGYVNATAMCKASGKTWSDYIRLTSTKAFVYELSSVLHIPQGGLIQSYTGGVPHLQGTWVHPQVAVHLAQWLSPKFAVLVTQWVAEWMSGNPRSSNLPYHLRRYMANMHNVPYGYFSMLNEVTLHLIGPLEQLGYTISSNQIPDISLGKTFSKYLREQGYPVNEFPNYPHQYEDGRSVPARAYPNELLGMLRKFFVEEWLKERSYKYFAERDPNALPYLTQFLALPNYREAMGYIESKGEYI